MKQHQNHSDNFPRICFNLVKICNLTELLHYINAGLLRGYAGVRNLVRVVKCIAAHDSISVNDWQYVSLLVDFEDICRVHLNERGMS